MYILIGKDNKIKRLIKDNSYVKTDRGLEFDSGAFMSQIPSEFTLKQIPDQDLDHLLNEEGDIEGVYPDNVEVFTLEETKARKLEEIRSEANRIITAKWPPYTQRNCDGGRYSTSLKDEMDQDIADVITASNNAEDEVANATMIDEVEAVEPNWPTI